MDFKDWLTGKKTYIAAIASICYALGGMVAGYIEAPAGIMIILAALGISGLRNGVGKLKVKEFVADPQYP